MHVKCKKFLYDMLQAADAIADFVANKTRDDYARDLMLRSAVERQFAIIGEALAQLRGMEPALVPQVSDAKRIIGFRNIIIHGYSVVDDDIVWDTVHTSLSQMRSEVENLLQRPDSEVS